MAVHEKIVTKMSLTAGDVTIVHKCFAVLDATLSHVVAHANLDPAVKKDAKISVIALAKESVVTNKISAVNLILDVVRIVIFEAKKFI